MLDASVSNYAQNYVTQAYHSADLQAMVVSPHLAVVVRIVRKFQEDFQDEDDDKKTSAYNGNSVQQQ